MHENLHKNVNEVFIHIFMQIFMCFYEGQLKQQMLSSSFQMHKIFPILMIQMLFPPYSTGPWSQLQKGRKIPERVNDHDIT